MCVGLAVDSFEARHRRRASPVEAGDGQVKTVPEQVHGARLAAIPAGELLEHPVGPVEDPPEALYRVAVVSCVLAVLRERSLGRQAVRGFRDRHRDA